MYSNILVPVALDNPKGAAEAVKVAGALQADGASVTLLHVVEEIPGYVAAYIPEGIPDQVRTNAKSGLDEIVKGLGAGVEVKSKIVGGHAARTILDEAEKSGADCIIIASHRPGLQDFLIGSTAAHVVRHADCSVHVIR